MKTGRAVIGANYGDEGKGLVTDYLANKGGDVVVRFNGGCQAGHTVVTPDGQRHVFSHFGSGTFLGLPTYLSEDFIVNPALLKKELACLHTLGIDPQLYVNLHALVTTPWDMNEGQDFEKRVQHGSCGMGLYQTMFRNQTVPLSVGDLLAGASHLAVSRVADYYDIPVDNIGIGLFLNDCKAFAQTAIPTNDLTKWNDIIFEGAQGLLLSQDNVWRMPHLTPSYCGMRNVRKLAWQAGIDRVEPYYVSRTYMTRHGNGPLVWEDPGMKFKDNTNTRNQWQGKLRQAPLNGYSMIKRIHTDHEKPNLVLTHCDQRSPEGLATPERISGKRVLYSYGPTRNDVTEYMRPVQKTGTG